MKPNSCGLIVSEEDSYLAINNHLVVAEVNGMTFKAVSDLFTFELYIQGLLRGRGEQPNDVPGIDRFHATAADAYSL